MVTGSEKIWSRLGTSCVVILRRFVCYDLVSSNASALDAGLFRMFEHASELSAWCANAPVSRTTGGPNRSGPDCLFRPLHPIGINGFRMTTSPIRCPAFQSSVHSTNAWACCAAVTIRASQNDSRYRSACSIARRRSGGSTIMMGHWRYCWTTSRAYRVVRDSDNIDVKLMEDLVLRYPRRPAHNAVSRLCAVLVSPVAPCCHGHTARLRITKLNVAHAVVFASGAPGPCGATDLRARRRQPWYTPPHTLQSKRLQHGRGISPRPPGYLPANSQSVASTRPVRAMDTHLLGIVCLSRLYPRTEALPSKAHPSRKLH